MQSDIFCYELLRPNGANDMGCFNFKLVVPLLFMQLNFALSIRICNGHAATVKGAVALTERGGGPERESRRLTRNGSHTVHRKFIVVWATVVPLFCEPTEFSWLMTENKTLSPHNFIGVVVVANNATHSKIKCDAHIAAQLVICTRCEIREKL